MRHKDLLNIMIFMLAIMLGLFTFVHHQLTENSQHQQTMITKTKSLLIDAKEISAFKLNGNFWTRVNGEPNQWQHQDGAVQTFSPDAWLNPLAYRWHHCQKQVESTPFTLYDGEGKAHGFSYFFSKKSFSLQQAGQCVTMDKDQQALFIPKITGSLVK